MQLIVLPKITELIVKLQRVEEWNPLTQHLVNQDLNELQDVTLEPVMEYCNDSEDTKIYDIEEHMIGTITPMNIDTDLLQKKHKVKG